MTDFEIADVALSGTRAVLTETIAGDCRIPAVDGLARHDNSAPSVWFGCRTNESLTNLQKLPANRGFSCKFKSEREIEFKVFG